MPPPLDDQPTEPSPGADPLENAPTASQLDAQPLPGTRRFRAGLVLADRYRVLRFLAEGGMGEIYEVEDLQLGERVALKTVRAGAARDPVALERFKREIQLARRVTHRNVCRIFEFGSHSVPGGERIDFLTMELLSGETLLEKLQRDGSMTPDQAQPLVEQMVTALEAAHRAGVVHRDFKSANVLLVPAVGGPVRAVVTDFGLAQVVAGEAPATSDSGVVSGTLDYMAPEQIEGHEPTPAVDVYALGVVMYEMLTGKRPFDGRTYEARRRVRELAPSPRVLVPQLDQAWERLIVGCLERDAGKRLRDATEVARALPGRAVASRAKRFWLAAAAAAVTAAAVGGYGVVSLRPGDPVAAVPSRRAFAVLPFKNLSGQSDVNWLSNALSEMLTSELAAGQKLRAIPGEDVARMRVELQVPETDALAKGTLSRIQANLGTDLIVSGSFLSTGPRELRLDVRVQEARAGETVATVVETGTREDVLAVVSRAGRRIRQSLGLGGLTPAQAGELRAAQPANAEAARLYAAGLARLRGFDALAARALLERAVAADPRYPLAHAALADALSRLGYEETAREEARLAFEQGQDLPREDRLLVEARYREIAREWAKAVEIHRTLAGLFPDDLDHGLRLVQTLNAAGRPQQAAEVVATLRRSPTLPPNDPGLDLVDAEVAQALGDFRREREAARRAADTATALGARLLLAQARVFESYASGRLGLQAEAMAAAVEARTLYAAAGDRGGEAWALNRFANVLYQQGELVKAERYYREAEALSDDIGYKGSLTALLNNTAEVFFLQGQLERANDALERARTYSRQSADPRTSLIVRLNMANVAADRGDYRRALQVYAQILAETRALGDRSLEGSVRWHWADALLYQGDLAAAHRAFSEGLAILERQGNLRYVASALTGLSHVQREQADAKGAREGLERALALRRQTGDKFGLAETRLALAQLDLDAHRPQDAEVPLREAAAVFTSERASDSEAEAHMLLAEALAAQGRLGPALEAARRADAVAENSERPHVRMRVTLQLARLRVRESAGEARRQIDAVRAQAERLGAEGLELEAGLALAEIEAADVLAPSERERIAGLEREARQRGFLRIADRLAEPRASH
jgi:tetratricopeptide (TPR) repeat protein/tRNA A-37 threonylcarbamoyl transferase component Bud32